MPKPLPLGATATTAASGGNREELLGPRPAGCERQRSRRWEPQPGQWHCEAMTERASPSPESRRAAISCLFGRAMLSLRLRFPDSILALSVTFGDSSPKGGAFGVSVGFHAGQAKLDVSGTVVLRCLGSRQLDKVRLSRSCCPL